MSCPVVDGHTRCNISDDAQSYTWRRVKLYLASYGVVPVQYDAAMKGTNTKYAFHIYKGTDGSLHSVLCCRLHWPICLGLVSFSLQVLVRADAPVLLNNK